MSWQPLHFLGIWQIYPCRSVSQWSSFQNPEPLTERQSSAWPFHSNEGSPWSHFIYVKSDPSVHSIPSTCWFPPELTMDKELIPAFSFLYLDAELLPRRLPSWLPWSTVTDSNLLVACFSYPSELRPDELQDFHQWLSLTIRCNILQLRTSWERWWILWYSDRRRARTQ